MIKPDEAQEIIFAVCDEYIPGRFEIGFDEMNGEPVIFVGSKSGNAYAWVLTEPGLTKKLIELDAHTFCAWVIRYEGDETVKRSKYKKIKA
jgi:hypothetical protein